MTSLIVNDPKDSLERLDSTFKKTMGCGAIAFSSTTLMGWIVAPVVRFMGRELQCQTLSQLNGAAFGLQNGTAVLLTMIVAVTALKVLEKLSYKEFRKAELIALVIGSTTGYVVGNLIYDSIHLAAHIGMITLGLSGASIIFGSILLYKPAKKI